MVTLKNIIIFEEKSFICFYSVHSGIRNCEGIYKSKSESGKRKRPQSWVNKRGKPKRAGPTAFLGYNKNDNDNNNNNRRRRQQTTQ